MRLYEAPSVPDQRVTPWPCPASSEARRGEGRGSEHQWLGFGEGFTQDGGPPVTGLAAPDGIDHGEDEDEEEDDQHGPQPHQPRLPLGHCEQGRAGSAAGPPGGGSLPTSSPPEALRQGCA